PWLQRRAWIRQRLGTSSRAAPPARLLPLPALPPARASRAVADRRPHHPHPRPTGLALGDRKHPGAVLRLPYGEDQRRHAALRRKITNEPHAGANAESKRRAAID